MEKNGIDHVFEIGLLLVAVIAVAELQYTSFIFGQNQMEYALSLTQVIFVFKVTTIPIFILVTTWLIAMIFPHVKIPLVKRRYLKEFCWALLGNVLALEIILFNVLSLAFGSYPIDFRLSQRVIETIALFFLTLLATWHYRKADSANVQSSIKFGLITVVEHGLIYLISYFLISMIVVSSTIALL